MQVILEFGHTSTLRDVVDVDPGTATHDWEVGLDDFRFFSVMRQSFIQLW